MDAYQRTADPRMYKSSQMHKQAHLFLPEVKYATIFGEYAIFQMVIYVYR